jgi:CheY-like chemotaxis protein/anti-sigma regulatory factor (Ser/Thr protein kinase)
MSTILAADDEPGLLELMREVLESKGHTVVTARDGLEALDRLAERRFDLVLTDIGMPRMDGLELLDRIRRLPHPPRVAVLTGDDTSETLLQAARAQALCYATKAVTPEQLLKLVDDALAAPRPTRSIEVISARPHWVELLVPCERAAAEQIQGFLAHLDADLPADVREAVGRVFRELLLNAIEWGGQLDPDRYVRVAYLRAKRMLLYRIADPGPGFRFEDLKHAAITNAPDEPLSHAAVREDKGLRPGGLGLLMASTMADELLYNEKQNEVVFVKYLV